MPNVDYPPVADAPRSAKPWSATRRILVPFLCGLVAAPVLIVVHELGHCAMGKSFGWNPRLRFAVTQFDYPKDKFSPGKDLLVTAAGPLLGTLLAAGGFLWLRKSRANRPDGIVTAGDWAATCLVTNVGRWFRSFVNTPRHPQPADEALISRAIGMPGWLLPYLLGVVAIIAVIMTIRLHPPGNRLVPLLSLAIGGSLGSILWMKALGPALLP